MQALVRTKKLESSFLREKGFFCVPIETSTHPGGIPEPPMFVLSLANLAFVYLDDTPGPADGFCL